MTQLCHHIESVVEYIRRFDARPNFEFHATLHFRVAQLIIAIHEEAYIHSLVLDEDPAEWKCVKRLADEMEKASGSTQERLTRILACAAGIRDDCEAAMDN